MRTISKAPLRNFWARHPHAKIPLTAWFKVVTHAEWANFAELKADFASADHVGDNRVVFDIGGNKYRIVAYVLFPQRRVFVKFVGTHKEYDSVDARTV